MFKKLIPFFICWFLVSCASVRSGKYIRIKEGQSVDTLAKAFSVSKDRILSANSGKNLNVGDWVFIPMDQGIVRAFENELEFGEGKITGKIGDEEIFWPVPASKRISSGFGKRGRKQHEGIDIPAPRGSHIMAIADGTIVYSGSKLGGYGNITVIKHVDGYFSIYAHAKKNFTKKGMFVNKGQVIAQVGSTGRSTGPHLHFEIRKLGKAIDPLAFYQQIADQYLAEN